MLRRNKQKKESEKNAGLKVETKSRLRSKPELSYYDKQRRSGIRIAIYRALIMAIIIGILAYLFFLYLSKVFG